MGRGQRRARRSHLRDQIDLRPAATTGQSDGRRPADARDPVTAVARLLTTCRATKKTAKVAKAAKSHSFLRSWRSWRLIFVRATRPSVDRSARRVFDRDRLRKQAG